MSFDLGLRKCDSRPWRCEWQNGLPADHGKLCILLPSDLHKGADCRHFRLHSFPTDAWWTTAPLHDSSGQPRPDESHLILIHFLITSLPNLIISPFFIYSLTPNLHFQLILQFFLDDCLPFGEIYNNTYHSFCYLFAARRPNNLSLLDFGSLLLMGPLSISSRNLLK